MYIKEAYIQEVYKYNLLKGDEYMRETEIDDSHIYTPIGPPFWRMQNNLLFYIGRVWKKRLTFNPSEKTSLFLSCSMILDIDFFAILFCLER